MKRANELSDLRKANDHRAQRERRRAHYKARTQQIRDRRRCLDLLVAGVTKGWLGR